MIKIINATKFARQPFFQLLIQYLDQREDVGLRQIKADFPDEKHLDRKLDQYIEAGYIKRENRRYSNAFSLAEKLEDVSFDQETFVDTDSPFYAELEKATVSCTLKNTTNDLVIEEEVDFLREKLTLNSYFYKLSRQEKMSPEQEKLYALLGDVNEDYALKYMTTFLLKFARKDVLLQRRPDIFVQSLVILGYIEDLGESKYGLLMEMDKENLIFTAKNS